MNNAKSILLFFLLCVFSFLQAQVQEYDLNNINTIKDAESYYNACMAVPFRDDVSKDDIYEMLKRLYALSKRICMRSIDDKNDIDEYSCNIQATNQDEERALDFLRSKVSQSYLCVQQLINPYCKPIDDYAWRNFELYYTGSYNRKSVASIQKIIWYETELNEIKLIEFHNVDDDFAYDINIYYQLDNGETLIREYTLMPNKMKVISSNVDGTNIYFRPTSFEITSKYPILK